MTGAHALLPPGRIGVVTGCFRQRLSKDDRVHWQLTLDSHHSHRERMFVANCDHTGTELALGQRARLDPKRGLVPLPASLPEALTDTVLAERYAEAADAEVLDRLLWQLAGLKTAPVRGLLAAVLADPAIGPGWVRLPGSVRHHHAEPGGLLAHSVEMAGWAAHLGPQVLPESEQDLAVAAAQCHDLGKVQTLSSSFRLTALGRWVRHETVTLQLLAPHLAVLQAEWPQGAAALTHALSWFPTQDEPLPRLPLVVLLRQLDQLSTVNWLRTRAFAAVPPQFDSAPGAEAARQRYLRLA